MWRENAMLWLARPSSDPAIGASPIDQMPPGDS
jgi:hypothetical protein